MKAKEQPKKREGKTWMASDGSLRCDECCNKERCDEPSHYYRPYCPFCLGTGVNASNNNRDESKI